MACLFFWKDFRQIPNLLSLHSIGQLHWKAPNIPNSFYSLFQHYQNSLHCKLPHSWITVRQLLEPSFSRTALFLSSIQKNINLIPKENAAQTPAAAEVHWLLSLQITYKNIMDNCSGVHSCDLNLIILSPPVECKTTVMKPSPSCIKSRRKKTILQPWTILSFYCGLLDKTLIWMWGNISICNALQIFVQGDNSKKVKCSLKIERTKMG